MSSIEDIWASMNEEPLHSKKVASAAVAKKPKKNKDKKSIEETRTSSGPSSKEILDYATMTAKIARDVQSCEETEIGVRKKALSKLHSTLFIENEMTDDIFFDAAGREQRRQRVNTTPKPYTASWPANNF